MPFDDGKKTVSGAIAHTDDAAAKVPFVSLKCGIAPTLTGKSAIECTQTRKNLIDFTQFPITQTNYLWGYRNVGFPLKKGVTYTFSCSDAVSSLRFVSVDEQTVYAQNSSVATDHLTYTPTDDILVVFRLWSSGISVSWVQLEVGATVTAYTEYVTPTTHTASLGRTIYGGTADVVNGTGTDMGAIHTITSENVNELSRLDGHRWYIHNRYIHCITPSTDDADSVVCDKLKSQIGGSVYDNRCFINSNGAIRINTTSEYATNSDFLEDFGGSITFAFILDASYYTDFTFTPITPTPETVGKVNNVYCNTGNTEVTYYDNAHGFSEITVNRCGKNLWDEQWEVGGINDATGVPNSDTDKIRSKTFSIMKGGATYYAKAPNNIRVLFYASDYSFLSETNNIMNATFTAPSNCVYFKIRGTVAYGTTYNNDIAINYPSTETAYEEYSRESKTAYLHKVIYGGQADVVRGTCKPKNLFDDSTFPRTATDNTYYAQFQSNLAEGNKYKIPAIHIEPDVAYVLSFNVECNTEPFNASVGIGIGSYSRDIANANNNTSGRISVPFTLTSALKEQYGDILSFRVPRYSTPREFTFTISNVQLEKASTASEYAPHFEPFSFPPISMETDEGENTLFANEGTSVITYRKETE